MAKSRAEIQKDYRQRKKLKEGATYLKKETERVKKYYVPTYELSDRKLNRRRKKIRRAMRNTREKKKAESTTDQMIERNNENSDQIRNNSTEAQNRPCQQEETGPCNSTTNFDEHPSTSSQQLQVRMNFRTPAKKKSKTTEAKRKIQDLESRIETLKRSNERIRKRCYRQNISTGKSSEKSSDSPVSSSTSHLTPRRRVKSDLRLAGVSPSKPNIRILKKKLEFQYTVLDQLKQNIRQGFGQKKPCSNIRLLCGNLIRKYRLETRLASNLGIPRKQVLKALKTNLHPRKRLPERRHSMVNRVLTFLHRDDNSTCLPGKADALKVSGERKQKRVLNDYLYNLHVKFLSENKDLKISLSVFNRIRPKNFQLVKYTSRKTCLCQKHQNMVLKVKTLKSLGITTTNSPDTLVQQNTDAEILSKIDNVNENTVKFSQWKRVDVEHKGRTLKRMQIVNSEETKDDFRKRMEKDLSEFRIHIFRVKCQYEQVRKLKEILPNDHAICQMDFAKNYSCGHADEVQSAYFDKTTVTLHPVVIYTKPDSTEDKLRHNSCVIVSDVTTHNSTTVFAFMKRVVTEVKKINKDVKVIHYITDSPTSQYRNKYIFNIIARHDKIFDGIRCSWQYFESGHGKGPCDGVGGTAKRCADSAVKRHASVIQNAEDFYNWGSAQEEKSQIKYLFVPKSQCKDAESEMAAVNVKPVKGTFDIHSVVPRGNGTVAVRNTSCFCDQCFSDGNFHPSCDGWKEFHLIDDMIDDHNTESSFDATTTSTQENSDEGRKQDNSDNIDILNEGTEQNLEKNEANAYETDSFVAVEYEEKWYLGKILEYDPDDLEYNITFMEEGQNKRFISFKWPKHADNLWISESSIICKVNEPVLFGTGTRKVYRLDPSQTDEIVRLFENRQ